ncbi:polymorphic toxin type 50 domain-containing protein [Veillonella rogosae]
MAHTSPSVCKSSGFIGSYVDKDTGDETPTEWGIIHSSKKEPILFLHCLI